MTRPDIQVPRGPAAHTSGGTELASGQWHAFGGRGRRWERSIDVAEGEAEQRIVAAVAAAQERDALAAVDREWIAFLAQNALVAALAFNRCGRVLQAAVDRCRPSRIAGGLALQASMQHRQAQSIVLYMADMEHVVGEVPIEDARARWATDPAWVPANTALAALRRVSDWGEAVVAVNLCFEPLVGRFLRRELAVRTGAAHGDPVSPVVAAAGEAELRLSSEWTVALVGFLVDDPLHGSRNRALLEGWLALHLPGARHAARSLEQLRTGLPRHEQDESGLERLAADHRTLLAAAGL